MNNRKYGWNIFTNTYIDCPDCGIRLEHRPGLSDDDGYLECPICKWSITDQEFEDGEYEDGTFGKEI